MNALQRKVAQVLSELPLSERGIEGYTSDGYYFQVEREINADHFYIIVKAPCGSTCYDGWWSEGSWASTLEEAVEEAIKGSGIVEE